MTDHGHSISQDKRMRAQGKPDPPAEPMGLLSILRERALDMHKLAALMHDQQSHGRAMELDECISELDALTKDWPHDGWQTETGWKCADTCRRCAIRGRGR